MRETWSYDKDKRVDGRGRRWHFVYHSLDDPNVPYEERPVEYYFRDDAREVFGVLRFERRNDNPFRSYEVLIRKLMNDEPFREGLIRPETAEIWNRNWK